MFEARLDQGVLLKKLLEVGYLCKMTHQRGTTSQIAREILLSTKDNATDHSTLTHSFFACAGHEGARQ